MHDVAGPMGLCAESRAAPRLPGLAGESASDCQQARFVRRRRGCMAVVCCVRCSEMLSWPWMLLNRRAESPG